MILVAGGTGFIGRSVVKRLMAAGRDVAVMTAHPDRSRAVCEKMGVRAVAGDVQDEHSLPGAVEGADAVIQALTFPSFPVEKPSRRWTFEEFDHLGTARLARAAVGAGVKRFVYVSGSGAGPNAEKVWFRATWLGEEALRMAALDHVIVRPSWIYGPEDVALNRFVSFYRLLPFVPVVGDGKQRLQPVFIRDVANVLAQAASPAGPTGTFEIGGPMVMTMNQVLTAMMDIMGKVKPLVHVPPVMPRMAGAVARFLPKPPLSPDAVDFLTGDALADNTALLNAFDVELTPLGEGLFTYLPPPPRRR